VKEKTLGDRMKRYEMEEAGRAMLPLLPIMVRLDGKAFHTLTRGMQRPYDPDFMWCMIRTMMKLVEEFHPTLGYTQSDEITLYWRNDNPYSDMLFDGRFQKWHSVLASACTDLFKDEFRETFPDRYNKVKARFDCRVWQLPNLREVQNNFQWREEDAVRNSLQMAGQAYYSHKQMHKKNAANIHDMLHEKDVNWNNYPASFKRGTYATRRQVGRYLTEAQMAKIPEAKRPPAGMVIRTEVWCLDLPPVSQLHPEQFFELHKFNTRGPLE
jgi:tRNA(His) guanylyltransferase